eukprot:6110095-Pyramimonas_sp.AAC.1
MNQLRLSRVGVDVLQDCVYALPPPPSASVVVFAVSVQILRLRLHRCPGLPRRRKIKTTSKTSPKKGVL